MRVQSRGSGRSRSFVSGRAFGQVKDALLPRAGICFLLLLLREQCLEPSDPLLGRVEVLARERSSHDSGVDTLLTMLAAEFAVRYVARAFDCGDGRISAMLYSRVPMDETTHVSSVCSVRTVGSYRGQRRRIKTRTLS